MRGLKLLFKSFYKSPILFWGVAALSAAGGALPFFAHEAFGSEEYLFPKMFLFFPMILLTEIGLICGCRDIGANRLMRSMPIARELYTRSVPAFITILIAGTSAVMLAAYFIFLGVIGAESTQFADTLICGAVLCLPTLIISPLVVRIPGGGVLAVYPVFLPAILLMVIGGDKVQASGFGVPLGAAAAIFTGTVIIGVGFAFWISAVRFRKSNVKIVQQQMPVE